MLAITWHIVTHGVALTICIITLLYTANTSESKELYISAKQMSQAS